MSRFSESEKWVVSAQNAFTIIVTSHGIPIISHEVFLCLKIITLCTHKESGQDRYTVAWVFVQSDTSANSRRDCICLQQFNWQVACQSSLATPSTISPGSILSSFPLSWARGRTMPTKERIGIWAALIEGTNGGRLTQRMNGDSVPSSLLYRTAPSFFLWQEKWASLAWVSVGPSGEPHGSLWPVVTNRGLVSVSFHSLTSSVYSSSADVQWSCSTRSVTLVPFTVHITVHSY